MNKYLKVEGHDSLVRDTKSNAILSTSDHDYESYKRSRDNVMRQRELIKNQNEEIQNIKSEMREIKQMLSILIKGR